MMHNKHLFLAASATVLLSLPNVGLAADNQEKDQHGQGQRNAQQESPQQQGKPERRGGQQQQSRPQQQANPQQQGRPQQQASPQQQSRPQQQANPQQQGRPQQQASPQQQSRPQRQANPQQQDRLQQQASPQQQSRPQRQANPQQQDRLQQQASPQQQSRPQRQAIPQEQGRPQQQAGSAEGNRTAVAAHHVQQSNQWRFAHSNWNTNTVWQRNPNWWRGNEAFANYTGVRVNFFYAPGFGYYSVPREYRGSIWNAGAYLPSFFLRYVVSDYRDYGLPPPPYGCSWIWVNTNVLLVDLSDGYILDEIDNVW